MFRSAIRRITPAVAGTFTFASGAYLAHRFTTSSQTEFSPAFPQFNSTLQVHAEEVPFYGIPNTKYERTFLMIKPDGVQRQLVGEIIQRFERKGFVLVGLKMVEPSKDLVSKHYADLSERPFYNGLVNYMSSSGPVVAMVFQGKGVVKYSRVLLGETNPLTSAPGTIRGDYSVDIGRNTIHGSDSTENAQTEIKLWFTDKEVANWTPSESAWVYEK